MIAIFAGKLINFAANEIKINNCREKIVERIIRNQVKQ